MYKFELEHYIFLKIKGLILWTYVNLKSETRKEGWVRKSQIRKVSHLRKVSKSNELFKGTIQPDWISLRVVSLDRP
jgi:hypothetical protein